MNRHAFTGSVSAVFASIAIVPRAARAAEFVFKHGHPLAQNHPLNVRAVEMWKAVERDTGGRVSARVFPSSTLGGDTQMLAQLRAGSIEFLTFSSAILGNVVPVSSIDSVGCIWKDRRTALSALDGELGRFVRKEIEAKGIHVFDTILENGFRVITSSNKPLHNADDLIGLKIRTPASAVFVDMFKAVGASPTPMNFSEVYTALQTHVIDAQENPYAVIETSRVYEVQKFLAKSNHSWGGYYFLANGDLWKSIPADIKATIDRHARQYALRERRDLELLSASLADKLARLGLQMNAFDLASMRAKLGGYYQKQREYFGPTAWNLLEAAAGKLA